MTVCLNNQVGRVESRKSRALLRNDFQGHEVSEAEKKSKSLGSLTSLTLKKCNWSSAITARQSNPRTRTVESARFSLENTFAESACFTTTIRPWSNSTAICAVSANLEGAIISSTATTATYASKMIHGTCTSTESSSIARTVRRRSTPS